MNIDWQIGDVIRRVSEHKASAMPIGVGTVTDVDHLDREYPVRVGEWYWPHVSDIVLESRKVKSKSNSKARAINQMIRDLDIPRAIARKAYDAGYRKFEIIEGDV